MRQPTVPSPTFELQGHSTYSDGELAPAEVVRAAKQAGVALFSLTDHDSVEGVPEAIDEAAELGIRLAPGVEISVLDPVASDLHLCGYLIDHLDQALQTQLARSREDRGRRAERMIAALERHGWSVDRQALDERLATGATVGRPHLAQAVVTHPANAKRLGDERLTSSSEFLVAYLIEGKPAFSPREAPSIAEAIELIHGAGGVAVWAHPFWDVESDGEVIATLERFTALGLDGVEAFYVTHTQAQTDLLVRRATELSLLTTGSSDYHGPHHRQFNRFGQFSTYGHEPNLGRLAG
jgi:3',5'-nucleoside bisphosphate phosphatase